ncbi:DUF982 domain-containing protein [Mesorhizobium sp. YM1C-6-2]|nr:DUF982 domain-containing protein [Mesorhizobium sp. YM1C-6-2]
MRLTAWKALLPPAPHQRRTQRPPRAKVCFPARTAIQLLWDAMIMIRCRRRRRYAILAKRHDEALDFLDKWPRNRRGPIYEIALRACRGAYSHDVPLDVARSAFVGFARSAGIHEK